LLASLAWAGMAWAQQPPLPAGGSAAAPNSQRTFTVQEAGKPAQKCRVLKTWQTAEGVTAYQVQAVDTGEIMTIVEGGQSTSAPGSRPGSRVHAVASRIFHWGRDATPPEGTPVPPEASEPPLSPTPAHEMPRFGMPVQTQDTLSGSTAAKSSSSSPTSMTRTTTVPSMGDSTRSSASTITPAAPSDWRSSWGKANDYRTSGTSGRAPQTVTTSHEKPEPLPQADSSRSDPLQAPAVYSVPAAENKLSAKGFDSSSQKIPLGAGSVISSAESSEGGVQYIPVPIVTMPDVTRPPFPPIANVPQAPQPIPQRQDGRTGLFAGRANRALNPMPTTTDPGMVNAFTPLPSGEQVANASNAFYSVDPNRGAPPMPASAFPAGMPQGPAGMPNPAMAAAQYAAAMQAGYASAANASQVQQALATLRDSLYPSQREWAADGLVGMDWRVNPEVLQGLVTAAHDDPAPTVRAACVRCLARMNANTVPVVSTIQGLRSDADPRVRFEVEQALSTLSPSQTGLQPTGAMMPGHSGFGN
jgi:hypothetical protein